MLATLLLLSSLAAAPAEPPLDPGFEAIVSAVSAKNHDESCAAMEAWIARHPDSPDSARGLLWMARLRLMDGRPDLARPLLERAEALGKGTKWELPAVKEIAELDVRAHAYGKAIAAFDRLAAQPDPFFSSVGRIAAEEARAARARWYLLCALATAMALLAAARLGLAARAGRKPWIPPREALFALPLAALLLRGAEMQPPSEMRAVVELTVGGFLLLWVTGASLRGRPLSRRRRVGEVLLGVAQTAALLFCALAGNELWHKFIDTFRMGAE